MEGLKNYINPELIMLTPVLYILGIVFKNSFISNKWIPILLGGISIVLCFLWTISKTELNTLADIAVVVFTSVTQGILVAGLSVYFNQIYKQMKK